MNKDKLIGNITIAAVLLCGIYVVFSMWKTEKRAHNTVLVQFSEMGALQNEDIVTIRGFTVGRIASIVRSRGKALVEIDLDEPRIFRKDTRFRNISPNIMGSRSIAVELGKNEELAPVGHIFNGEFEPGLAEVLVLSEVIKEHVAALMEVVRVLHKGDKNNPSLQKKIEDFMEESEFLILTLHSTVNIVEKQVMDALNKVGYYTEQMSDASIKISESLDTIRIKAKDGIEYAEEVVLKVKGSIKSLNNILDQLENHPVTAELLDKKGIIDDIDSLLFTLQAFISSIDEHGLKIYDDDGKRKSMIHMRNIHLIRETARSKAKKRAEQGN